MPMNETNVRPDGGHVTIPRDVLGLEDMQRGCEAEDADDASADAEIKVSRCSSGFSFEEREKLTATQLQRQLSPGSFPPVEAAISSPPESAE